MLDRLARPEETAVDGDFRILGILESDAKHNLSGLGTKRITVPCGAGGARRHLLRAAGHGGAMG